LYLGEGLAPFGHRFEYSGAESHDGICKYLSNNQTSSSCFTVCVCVHCFSVY